MLEDIGKIVWMKKCVAQAKSIYLQPHMGFKPYEKNTRGKELVRSAITRFATNFLSLQSMLQQKANLMKMFSCDEWNGSKWSKRVEGKEIVDKVFEKYFGERQR